MILMGYEDIYSFNGEYDCTMLIVKDKETIGLTNIFKWMSIDNFVDKREAYESIIVNIENKDNLKDIFNYRFNMLNKTKITKANLTITYYDKRFERHIQFLIKKYKKNAEKSENIIANINLVFEYAPYDKAYIEKYEFAKFLKEAYKIPKHDIDNIMVELKK